ncbi:MAG: carboxylating nicotinate-nucleotide diphosphorylase [Myxococcales bacterium]|nr:carboxylating nicotinate-nucleotide diphosphorylase [Myxococcales bacterium]
MIAHPSLLQIVDAALHEDLGRGDITTEACVPADAVARTQMVAREELVWCGADVVTQVYARIDPSVATHPLGPEGARVSAGTALMEIHGSARSVLMGERVALNFVQRMSAVATITRTCVDALPPGSHTRITDTRKTTPGLRALERYAVRVGGGHNHREDLAAAVLIKDNHIAAAGSVRHAIDQARARAPHTARITCEVDTLEQLEEALAARADVVMLDNFSDEALARGVEAALGKALIEVSGGITPDRVRKLSEAGADVISIGALTHSAGSVDIGLDWTTS